ncbi:unnamed protein product [Ceratitis capitata]|uniref:tRNA-splicing endonuclease subunit Sen34 n=1 Tax=Ceratitis capitata TaxID=7213 RepID=A0A811V1R2_CERCA|nr:unnamed protein product [Ceratitis capitata]
MKNINVMNEKLNLTLINGTGYVFKVEDYMTLRRKHRIVGALVGTCNVRGWSANDCMERGIAQLVSKRDSLLRVPDEKELAEYHKNLEVSFSAQSETLKAEKLRETERNMSKILAGKRKKLLREGVSDAAIELDASKILQETADNFVFDRKNVQLEIACSHDQPHAFKIVDTPPIQSPLKYKVFCDFWSRGHYVTAGDAFGADFLLYPGDPLQYHASHIVILLDSPIVQPLDLIAKVRLSVIVNKICIFAYFVEGEEKGEDNAEREVHYQTVQWEGNRDRVGLVEGPSEQKR